MAILRKKVFCWRRGCRTVLKVDNPVTLELFWNYSSMNVGKIWPGDFWFVGSRYFFFSSWRTYVKDGRLVGHNL